MNEVTKLDREAVALSEIKERISVSMGMRVQLPSYERAELSINLSGIPNGASEELIEEMLDTSKVAYSLLKKRLLVAVQEARNEKNGQVR